MRLMASIITIPVAEINGQKLHYPLGLSDYKEITETEYNAATTGKGDRIPLVATKTNNEITRELS